MGALFEILFYFVAFVVNTVVLLIALFIMVKIQKLECKFLGLIGAAAASIAVKIGLEYLFGRLFGEDADMLVLYITHPIVCLVLIIGVAKVTQAETVDVLFTVFVGYAVEFCIQLFLLGAVMGDLRDLRSEGSSSLANQLNAPSPTQTASAQPANAPPTTKEPAASATNDEEMVAAADEEEPDPETDESPVAAEQPVPPPSNPSIKESLPNVTAVSSLSFSLKGISKGGKQPSAMIRCANKTYNLDLHKEISVRNGSAKVLLRLDEVREESVVLSVDGKQAELFLY